MAYRLKFDQTIEAGAIKIAREQLQRAVRSLTTGTAPGGSAVHDTRKCLKRTRALLRLIKPGMPPAIFRAFDIELRDTGRSLAAARDTEILDATLNDLELFASETEAAAVKAVLSHVAGPNESSGSGGIDPAITSAAAEALTELAQRLKKLKLQPAGFDCVEHGLSQGVRHARKAMAHAYAEETSEAFHEWRKTVQRHWRHMQLLSRAWPAMFEARIELARQLSQTLGNEHDLTILNDYLARLPKGVLTADQTHALDCLIGRRQEELRLAAAHMGEILFAEKPKPFAHRIATVWRAARQRAEANGAGNGAMDATGSAPLGREAAPADAPDAS